MTSTQAYSLEHLADAIGRRKAFLVSFVISGVSIAYLFPFPHSYTTYLIVIPIVGFGLFGALSGNFVYGPEMFSPSMRASGIALANSIGRYITAAGPLVAGSVTSAPPTHATWSAEPRSAGLPHPAGTALPSRLRNGQARCGG